MAEAREPGSQALLCCTLSAPCPVQTLSAFPTVQSGFCAPLLGQTALCRGKYDKVSRNIIPFQQKGVNSIWGYFFLEMTKKRFREKLFFS